MTLDDKVSAAKTMIGRCLDEWAHPVVFSSFGKDSLVMMSIIDSVRPGLPVVCYREPFCHDKYQFTNEVIRERGLAVYDYPPCSTSVFVSADGNVEIMNAYQIGPGMVLESPTGVLPPVDGEPFLCGHRDLYSKPLGAFVFPWNLALIGHKSSDTNRYIGDVPLLLDVVENAGGPAFAFPIRHFTDEDIWRYTEAHGLPIHHERYDAANGYREHADKRLNPDCFHACTRCLDPRGPDVVFCPKLKCEIASRKHRARQRQSVSLPYVGSAPEVSS
jgi:hypothetical protein